MFRLSLYTFLMYSSSTVIIFFLPIYMQKNGLSTTEIGSLFALGALVSIFSQPFWGYISDKWKTIRGVLIIVMMASLLSSIGLFALQSFWLLLLVISTYMFFNSAANPLTDSLSITYAYEHKRNYGAIRMWGAIGIGIFSFLLGHLIEKVGIGYLGWMYMAMVLAVIMATFLLQDSKTKTVPVTREGLKKLFTSPFFLIFLCMVLLISTPHRMNDSLLGIYLVNLGAQEAQVGKAWMIATLSAAPAFLLMGLLLRRVHELLMVTFAGFIYAIRWVLYSIVENPDALIYLQFIHSITFPLFFVACVQYVAKIVPTELRATGQTTLAAVFGGLGSIVGSAGGGWIMDRFTPSFAYLIGAWLSLAGTMMALAIFIYVYRKQKQEGRSVSA